MDEFDVDDDFDNDWSYEFEKKGLLILSERYSHFGMYATASSSTENTKLYIYARDGASNLSH